MYPKFGTLPSFNILVIKSPTGSSLRLSLHSSGVSVDESDCCLLFFLVEVELFTCSIPARISSIEQISFFLGVKPSEEDWEYELVGSDDFILRCFLAEFPLDSLSMLEAIYGAVRPPPSRELLASGVGTTNRESSPPSIGVNRSSSFAASKTAGARNGNKGVGVDVHEGTKTISLDAGGVRTIILW